MWQYFEMARKAALKKSDRREQRIGVVGLRKKDGVLVSSSNGCVLMSPTDTHNCYPLAHAEARIARKLDQGSVIFVCRIKKINGEYGLAKPCPHCEKALTARGIRRVYYTISNKEYGVLDLQ